MLSLICKILVELLFHLCVLVPMVELVLIQCYIRSLCLYKIHIIPERIPYTEVFFQLNLQ